MSPPAKKAKASKSISSRAVTGYKNKLDDLLTNANVTIDSIEESDYPEEDKKKMVRVFHIVKEDEDEDVEVLIRGGVK